MPISINSWRKRQRMHPSSALRLLPLVALLVTPVVLPAVAARDGTEARVLNRLHGVTNNGGHHDVPEGGDQQQQQQQQQSPRDRRNRHLQSVASIFDKVGTAGKRSFLQNAFKNGLDPVAVFQAAFESDAMKVLHDNVEVQHYLLEQIPLLGALPGFKHITGRRLGAEATRAGFIEGTKFILELSKGMEGKVKDPQYTLDLIKEMKESDDPETKELFRLASLNDLTAIKSLQDILSEKMFPGVDMQMVRETRDNLSFKKLLSFPELDFFVDGDETISKILRTPVAR